MYLVSTFDLNEDDLVPDGYISFYYITLHKFTARIQYCVYIQNSTTSVAAQSIPTKEHIRK